MIPDGFIGTSFIESYERSDKIGQGTFGEVTVAYHKVTGQKVALKRVILHKEKEGIPITTVREVQVLKLLHHKNIMSLHELTLEKGNAERIEPSRLYLVFPFMEHDLAGLLGNPAVLFEPQHIKSFARQILEGLAYIHKEHVLHRDLKTANILVDNRGNLRITDFGLARSYTERDYTLTPNVVTRWYRAPELIIGLKYYGTPVDMWGFACVFAELWDRRAVFRGDTEVQIMDKILTICGTPTKDDWPDFVSLTEQVNVKPKEHERKVRETWIPERFDYTTIEFIDSLFILNPATRPTAEQALEHAYFIMEPAPARPNTEE
ncbi:kinase-like domain-containing protein [Gaertneriomyces semiglobifer]|nr:kinase-like domain-containing protein [Gaertneriomyces semiglobifer]